MKWITVALVFLAGCATFQPQVDEARQRFDTAVETTQAATAEAARLNDNIEKSHAELQELKKYVELLEVCRDVAGGLQQFEKLLPEAMTLPATTPAASKPEGD